MSFPKRGLQGEQLCGRSDEVDVAFVFVMFEVSMENEGEGVRDLELRFEWEIRTCESVSQGECGVLVTLESYQ